MRLFVAVPITEEVRDALARVQARLMLMAERAGVRVKWVEPENFHLTVSFLGDLTEAVLPDLKDACAAVAAETSPFRIEVAGVSFFPKPPLKGNKELRTIWIGLSEGKAAWSGMIQRAEPYFVPFGAARDGGLSPHITLGRVKPGSGSVSGDTSSFRAALQTEATIPCGGMQADTLLLMESALDPRGATYREVDRWPFEKLSGAEA